MIETVGGVAPLAGSLTLLVADGHAARAWHGESEPGNPIVAFHEAHGADASACAPVAIGETASGWLAMLGAPRRDATVFRRAGHHLAIVGPYWEWSDEEAVPPLDPNEIERLIIQSEAEPIGTLEVPSGRLIVASAWSDLSGEPSKAPSILPPELRADIAKPMAEAAERRSKVLRNLDEVRKRIAACPLEERPALLKLIRHVLQFTAEGASGSIELFGETCAVVRTDTGDFMLVVPAGTYELALLEVPFPKETLGILRIEPA